MAALSGCLLFLLFTTATALAQNPPPKSPRPPPTPPRSPPNSPPPPFPPPGPPSSCYRTCTPNDLGGYLPPQPADPCNIGPSYWCLPGTNNMEKCNVAWNTRIGMCKYTNGKCPTMNMTELCKDPLALKWPGGLTNVPAGKYGYLAVALYWAPSSCLSNQTTGGGFCSSYTTKGKVGAKTLQLHGVWPDFGSFYGTPPSTAENPAYPLYTGSYQGWSQYCSANYPGAIDYSKCHVNGDLCPDGPVADQFAYERCMRKYNITDCLVEESVVTALQSDLEQYAAGHLGDDRTFIDHEFFKHGSCMGGYLTANKTAFYETSLMITKELRGPANYVTRLVQNSRGKSINTAKLTTAMRGMAVPRCNAKCQLAEVWYCYGRDAAGNPTKLINCPAGTLASDSCTPGIPFSRNCVDIIIPDFEFGPNIVP